MRPLLVLSARSVAIAVLAVLGVALAGGGIRLLPWLVAADIPFGLSAPFARRLAQGAGEAAVLLGVPVGVAASTARFVERGEARALLALGARPLRLLAGLSGLGLVFAAIYACISLTVDAEPPGEFATKLVLAGRRACDGEGGPRRVEVPLVGVTWLCFPAGPRLAGRLPGVAAETWFTAASVMPSADLRELQVEDLRVAGRFGEHPAAFRAGRARIEGLPTWGAPPETSPARRALAVAFVAWGLALSAAWIVLRLPVRAPVAASTVASLAAAALVSVLHALDARGGGALSYVVSLTVGIAVAVVGLSGVSGFRARPRRLVARTAPR